MTIPQTFFHVGYARAASTFLQKNVFPALTNIQYIPRNRFRVREKEKRRFRSNKILMSREAGQHIFQRCDDVARVFDSRIIISLRRQDALAASNYRLHVKKGHTIRFNQFLDLENDQGFWKCEEFEYMRLIRHVQETQGQKPIVLLFEDYLDNPDYYIAYLCAALDCDINRKKLNHSPVHKSYSDKQLRLRRMTADYFEGGNREQNLMKNKTPQGDSVKNYIRYRTLLWSSAIFMRLANLVPKSWLSDEPLLETQRLEQIKQRYQADWQACQDYVAEQNRELGITAEAFKR